MGQGELLDLVCGPASPLPETFQRYRLVAHLGAGGQAEVYRAVRLCGGVTSAPITVKVFRLSPNRPSADELRSWDKGDAVLMDLNNRGVTGICRRADGFYGPPPHRPGQERSDKTVPYQVYDYLHGVDLRRYIGNRDAGVAAPVGPVKRLSAVAALHTLAGVLVDLHEPADLIACPVLHMDVKPSNIMVLATGEIRLIDFTGARYLSADEITQIAYTPESAGPEALTGEVGPAYDVHGFAAVAFFLVTGALPRANPAVPPEQHPALAGHSALRDLLLAGLSAQPGDRPATRELADYADRVATLVRAAGRAGTGPGLDWSPAAAPARGKRAPVAHAGMPGTETDALARIEKLERELVELRVRREPATGPTPRRPSRQVPPTLVETVMRASAPVVARRAGGSDPEAFASVLPARRPRMDWRSRARVLKKGGGWTWFGAGILFFGWGVWAADTRGQTSLNPLVSFFVVLGVAAALFGLLRLLGAAVFERTFGHRRRSAVLAHLGTAAFLCIAGAAYLGQAPWVSNILDYLAK